MMIGLGFVAMSLCLAGIALGAKDLFARGRNQQAGRILAGCGLALNLLVLVLYLAPLIWFLSLPVVTDVPQP